MAECVADFDGRRHKGDGVVGQAGLAIQAEHGQYAAWVEQCSHFDQRLLERHMME